MSFAAGFLCVILLQVLIVNGEKGCYKSIISFGDSLADTGLLWLILQLFIVNAAEKGCYKSIISFGDSLADTGNLKQLYSIYNLDFPFFLPPYGENFLDQSTGRCSDGRLIIDFLGLLWVSLQLLIVNGEKGCYKSIISFGDSLADTGNLKQLSSIRNIQSELFLPPYGQNFLDHSTGRCSNGRLIIDFLAEGLGLPLVPPFVHEIENASDFLEFRQGVNYAVAGATALNSSVLEARGIVSHLTNSSLGVQLDWFKESLPYLCGNMSDCRKFIGSSLILMGEIGGNDYNFPISAGSPVDEIKPLVPLVIDRIISAVNELIEIGAQTLVVPGNFPIGCLPLYLTICGSEKEEYDPTTGCLIRLNEFAEYHNELLQMKLNQIREVHPNVNIIYADYYNAAMQIYHFPDKFGFTNGVLKACCGGGGTFNCNSSAECGMASASVCDQPDKYVSWDGIHFTEAAYRVIHDNLFQGPFTDPRFNSLCPTSTPQLGVGLSSSM